MLVLTSNLHERPQRCMWCPGLAHGVCCITTSRSHQVHRAQSGPVDLEGESRSLAIKRRSCTVKCDAVTAIVKAAEGKGTFTCQVESPIQQIGCFDLQLSLSCNKRWSKNIKFVRGIVLVGCYVSMKKQIRETECM